MIGNRSNFLTGALYLVLGGGVAIWSVQYGLGSLKRVSAGTFPFGLGVLLAVVGLALVVRSFTDAADGETAEGVSLKSLLIVLASIVLFSLSIQPLGMLISVPLLLIVSSLAHPHFSVKSIAISLLVLLPLTVGIFVFLLRLQFHLLPFFMRG